MDTKNEIAQKGGKPAVLLIYCLISTALLLYLGLYTVFPMLDFAGIAAIGVFCACYSLLVKKGNFLFCIIPAGVSLGVVLFYYGSIGYFGTGMLASLFNIAFPFILALILNAGVERKANTGAVFAVLSAAGAVYVLSLLMLVVYEMYGAVNADTIGQSIKDASEFLGTLFSEAPQIAMPFEEGSVYAMQYEAMYDEYRQVFAEFGRTIELTFKLTVPAMIAVCGMMMSAVIFILYRLAVKLAGMTQECFEGNKWRFEVTPLSAILFEIVFLIYIILMLFWGSSVLSVAFMNICSVLCVPFAYIGLRHLTNVLKAKLNSKAAGVVVIIAATLFLTFIFGASIFNLAALIGASSVTKKTIEDKLE